MKKFIKSAISALAVALSFSCAVPSAVSADTDINAVLIEDSSIDLYENVQISENFKVYSTEYGCGWNIIHNMNDMKAVYCIEPGKDLSHLSKYLKYKNYNYISYLAENTNLSSDNMDKLIMRTIMNGYTGNVDTVDSYYRYVATQLLIWETISGQRDLNFNKIDNGYTPVSEIMNKFNNNYLTKMISEYYNEYENYIKNDKTDYTDMKCFSILTPYYDESQTLISLNSYGDVDEDGNITSSDALDILNGVVGNKKSNALMDVDGDGNITSSDSLRVLQSVVGLV